MRVMEHSILMAETEKTEVWAASLPDYSCEVYPLGLF
jgi:hypothetical protein